MMKQMSILSILLIISTFEVPLIGIQNFEMVGQWNHGDKEIYTEINESLIDNSGHLVIVIERSKMVGRLITPKDVFSFAPIGQGPGDLYMFSAMCHYKSDVAFLEDNNKIKIFTKKDNSYAWKETKWLKMDRYPPMTSNILFINNKWFLAGFHFLSVSKKKLIVSLLQVYSDEGKPLKDLIKVEYPELNRRYQMDYYVNDHNNRLYFMVENELKIYEISIDQLNILREIPLETHGFYKKMPEDYYKNKVYNDFKDFSRDLDHWKTSYSIITRVVFEDGFLVIQIRTCSDKHKKFAMLFYDSKSFELKKTVFVDDLFMGSRNGIYYFYANGDPGLDEGTDKCIINLYSFVEEK